LILRYAVPPGHRRPGRPRRVDRADTVPGAASPLAGPLLYAGWLAARLDWRRYRTDEPLADGRMRLTLEGVHQMVELRLEPVETVQLAPGELASIRLRCYGETGAGEFIIDRTGPDEATVVSNVDGMTALLRRVRMDPPGEAELLARSLVTDRHDPVYEDALRAAAVFLASARPGSAAAA
jgi:glucose-6-phosphate dehydrogenase assembly protein OpcA